MRRCGQSILYKDQNAVLRDCKAHYMDAFEEIYLERDKAISRKLAAEELQLAEVRQSKSVRLLDLEAL